jgi:AraC-like DNA-binding protein
VRIVRSKREEIVATPNVATFYNAGEEYQRRPIDPVGDHADFFVLHPALLLPILEAVPGREPLEPSRPFRSTVLPSDPRSYLEQRNLTRYLAATTAPDGLLVEETAVRLLARLLQPERPSTGWARSERDGTAARRRALVERAEELLASRFRENLSLEKIAAAVGTSPAHLARVFRSETGRSLHRYRQELRLRAALELIADAPGELTEIALELGYSSHSHFTWAFRREFELPPSRYRSSRPTCARRDLAVRPPARASHAREGRPPNRARSR